ncbi:MAG: glutamate racemase [Firmicutes bacterium]|nr:glutamate racemase [Bacillota bacterium]
MSTSYPQTGYNLYQPITVFDSGVGGITVLAQARKLLPAEDFRYFADIANAPYGDKSTAQIQELMRDNCRRLYALGSKALVLACNTATSAAAAMLRQDYDLPILGLEPALKPAVLRHKRVLVMATRLTLREKKFAALLDQVGKDAQVIPLACPGLMEMVEEDFRSEKIYAYLRHLLEPYRGRAGALVLGCTHYVFLRRWLEENYPCFVIYDGNTGVSQHLYTVLAQKGLLRQAETPGNILWDCSLPPGEERRSFLDKCRRDLAALA